VVLCQLDLERPRLETETSAHPWSELSTYYVAAMPRMPFSWQYTLSTPSVEDAGRVSKSAAVVATLRLAQAKVGRGIPSWLIAAETALARARALVRSMVVARSAPSVALHRCSSVSWASRATRLPVSSS
jgi:hypothetical protein